ncbi:MAG: sulfotransferase [Nitrososphaera sp.]|nr:sulfotransferase [Nitrososphaera sp.]
MSADNYSALDKLIHGLAFRKVGLQRSLSHMEDIHHRKDLESIDSSKPVFITSLPRAGTTILLEALYKTGRFATHTYRSMPFVLCPILWHKISHAFQKNSELRERAHGDGILIGYDSPEAFEEIIWKYFWTDKYPPENIHLITEQEHNADFEDFFMQHMKKVIFSEKVKGCTKRYLSKNNANIGRIAYLSKLLPESAIFVPVRNPISHALSLHRQHLNFTELHAKNRFIKTYMEDIGHLDFGALHRPLLFPGSESLNAFDTLTPPYWLKYWLLAFTHLAQQSFGNVHFISIERLCAAPGESLRRIFEKIGDDTPDLRPSIQLFKEVKVPTNTDMLPDSLIAEAIALHTTLLKRHFTAH